jgi:anti-anti-sigma factor
MLHSEVTRRVHGGIKNIIFDLSALLYLSSSGIDCFTHALKLVRPRGGDVILAGATERVRGVISMYGFESTFRAVADVGAAFQVLSRLRDESSPDFPFRASCPSCGQELSVTNPEPLTCGGCGAPLAVRTDGRLRVSERSVTEDTSDLRQSLSLVQVFGQIELVEHLQAGGRHHTHCISIGNPRSIFSRRGPDNTVPPIIKKGFDKVLRLNFYDVEEKRHLRWRQFPKRIPRRSDVKRLIRFFRATKDHASGYTIHCWQGVSRSTAVALAFLYMMTGSEEQAKSQLQTIRPEAGPHQRLLLWFDQELGTHLNEVAAEMRRERFDRWKAELNML